MTAIGFGLLTQIFSSHLAPVLSRWKVIVAVLNTLGFGATATDSN